MSKKNMAKSLQMGVGSHDLGNATSIVSKPGRLEIEMTPSGALCTHFEFKRKILIPYANIKSVCFDFNSEFNGSFDAEELELEKVAINTAEVKQKLASTATAVKK